MPHDQVDDHPTTGPNELGSGAVAPDLKWVERDVATWCGALDRPDAPRALRRRILSGVRHSEPTRAGRLLAMFPLGGWGLASAALLLVALGTATFVELTDGGRHTGSSTLGSPDRLAAADGSAAQQAVRIVEDPSMALFHDVETFDEVGLVRGEVIADWGR